MDLSDEEEEALDADITVTHTLASLLGEPSDELAPADESTSEYVIRSARGDSLEPDRLARLLGEFSEVEEVKPNRRTSPGSRFVVPKLSDRPLPDHSTSEDTPGSDLGAGAAVAARQGQAGPSDNIVENSECAVAGCLRGC
jgi:hypothetical protein